MVKLKEDLGLAVHVWVNEKQAAKIMGVSPRSLQAWRLRGGGPAFVRVSKRCIRYRLADIQAWAGERLARSTSDPGR
ncbi:MAG TPA: helix-turn-helix domain-containing protein, partial [bacterium]|nr:helix-turn-helix domain-containing protein [bacterium]